MSNDKSESTQAIDNKEEMETQPVAEIDKGLASGVEDNFKWYIAKTATGQENKVSHSLKEAIVNHRLTDFFSRILVPEETVVTNAGGKKRTLKKKFFPYLFITTNLLFFKSLSFRHCIYALAIGLSLNNIYKSSIMNFQNLIRCSFGTCFIVIN